MYGYNLILSQKSLPKVVDEKLSKSVRDAKSTNKLY